MDSINFLSQVSRKGLHMKKVAFGIACGITAIFVFALMLTLYGRSARQTETNTILAQAVNSTLSHVMGERNDKRMKISLQIFYRRFWFRKTVTLT